jgi:hypothetical protein
MKTYPGPDIQLSDEAWLYIYQMKTYPGPDIQLSDEAYLGLKCRCKTRAGGAGGRFLY